MNAWDISFSSLSVGYGDHAVLHDINATLPGGKVSVILGGSGCGKSTLLRHIIGLSRPISGNLRIGGQDLFSLSHAEARRIRRRSLLQRWSQRQKRNSSLKGQKIRRRRKSAGAAMV